MKTSRVTLNNKIPKGRIFASDPTHESNGGWYEIKEYIKELDLSEPQEYKTFTYDISGNLSEINRYKDDSMSTLYYKIIFNYTLGNLSSQVITKYSDNTTQTKYYNYDISGNLININF
jgi:hypothetical protein